MARLERQHFADNPAIAKTYARKSQCLLVELDVPLADVLKHFRLEFQNFGLRKKKFEIVYVIDARLLAKNERRWKLKTSSFSS